MATATRRWDPEEATSTPSSGWEAADKTDTAVGAASAAAVAVTKLCVLPTTPFVKVLVGY